MVSIRQKQLRGNKQRDTGPELRLRSLFHQDGLRFRVNRRIGTGRHAPRPDIVFGPAKVAVFVDGCFWHSCPEHKSVPSVNQDYWLPKLARNVERDAENTSVLERMGWTVVRVWEHEDMEVAARRIAASVRDRR
jgi:DNA mismatch endonuclease (patch repair protein)